MDLTFDCTTQPHYAARGEHGHFEQAGKVSGSVALGGEQWQVSGYGVRDKSWGPRDWGAGQRKSDDAQSNTQTESQEPSAPAPFVNWFSMNFGADIALGGSCFRREDGSMRGAGWYQADGQTMALEDVEIISEYATDSILHTGVHLTATTQSGAKLDIQGEVLNVCPTKIAMPGGATFVNEGLARFDMDGRTGYGIAEHWHAISTGD